MPFAPSQASDNKPTTEGDPITSSTVDELFVDIQPSADSDLRSVRPRPVQGALIRADQVEAEDVQWLWPGRVPFGALTVLAGGPGLGKSLLTVALAAQLSRGELGDQGARSVVMSSAEDALAQVVVPRLIVSGATLKNIHFAAANRDGFAMPPQLPTDIGLLREKVEEVGAGLVVLDPLSAHLAGEVNTWKDQSIRLALAPLQRLAEESDAAVVLVAHLNKGESADPLQRLGGSVGLAAAARSVLLLAHDPDDPDGSIGDQRVLAHVKSNLSRLADSLRMRVDNVERNTVTAARIIEIGTSPYTGADLLSRDVRGTQSKLSLAIDLLKEELAAGPKPVSDLRKRAAAADISPSTLDRAREALSIETSKGSFGGGWFWSLPEPQAEAA